MPDGNALRNYVERMADNQRPAAVVVAPPDGEGVSLRLIPEDATPPPYRHTELARVNRKQLLYRLEDALDSFSDFPSVQGAYEKIYNDKDAHFVSLSEDDDGKIAYSKYPETPARRVRMALSRYIRRELGYSSDEIPDQVLDRLNRAVFPHFYSKSTGEDWSILTGAEITEAYENCIGAESCMTGSDSRYVEIYALNPDKVGLLVYQRRRARALLWRCDDGAQVIDRVYPAEFKEFFRRYARDHDMPYRVSCYCADSDESVELSDGSAHFVTLKHQHVFPYLDTFRYGGVNNGKVNLSNEFTGDCTVFDSTGGDVGNDAAVCENCGQRVNSDDVCFDDDGYGYCLECWRDRYTYCHECDRDLLRESDTTYTSDNRDSYCESCYYALFTRCTSCNAEIKNEDSYAGADDEIYCNDCYHERFGECIECRKVYILRELIDLSSGAVCNDCYAACYVKCENCGAEIHEDYTLLSNYDGRRYCMSCAAVCHHCGGVYLAAGVLILGRENICDDCVGKLATAIPVY